MQEPYYRNNQPQPDPTPIWLIVLSLFAISAAILLATWRLL